MMDGYSLDDAYEYVKLYPDYVEVRERLLEMKKRLMLIGDLKQLAQVEYMLGALSPWNWEVMDTKAKSIEIDSSKLPLPNNSDLHAVNVHTFSEDFLAVLIEAIKHGSKSAAEVYSYYLAHNSEGCGVCTEKDSMGSKLDEFLQQYEPLLGKRAHLLKLQTTEPDELFVESEMQDIESSCPEIRDMYDIHILDTEQDENKCRRAFMRLAGRVGVSAMAKYGIGFCYWNGYVVKKDVIKAAQWFRWAAAEGCCSAQNRLADIEQD